MRLILHIGYHKTGSTAIQHALSNVRTNLLDSRIFIPQSRSKWTGSPDLAWACLPQQQQWADIEKGDPADILSSWCAASSNANCDTIIISSEELCRLDLEPAGFARLVSILQPYDVSIIGYTRDPISFLLSRYRHEVQNGGEIRSVSDFLRNPHELTTADFVFRTSIWRAAFGDRVQTFDYHESMNKGDIAPHFFQLIGMADYISSDSSSQLKERRLHPALVDLRRYITVSIDSTAQPALLNILFDLSDSLVNLCPRELVLSDLINFTSFTRITKDLFPSAYPVVYSIEQSEASAAEKSTVICDFLDLLNKVRQASINPNQYALHLLWSPESDESELMALLASRYASGPSAGEVP